MSFIVELAENGKYIICRVTGTMTVRVARDFSAELDRLSRSTHVKRFLTDVREAPNASNTIDNYNFAYSDMAGLELQRNARAAILAAPDDKSHDFVETVSRNAGYNVRLFHEEDAAVAWLSEDEES